MTKLSMQFLRELFLYAMPWAKSHPHCCFFIC